MTGVDPGRAGGVSPLFTGPNRNRGLTPPARRLVVFALAALLVLPIFAHGCHGDGDTDTEPQAVVK